MMQPRVKGLVFSAAIVVALLAASSEANAHWWGCCQPVSCAYTSCWTSCCDPCWGSTWVLGWRPGPIRRLLFGRYKWYPVSWGAWDCCSSWTWEPCCTEVAYAAPATTVLSPEVQQPTLAPQRPTTPATPAPGPSRSIEEEFNLSPEKAPVSPKKTSNPSTSDERSRGHSGLLSIDVPAAAKVYINGRETRTTGSRREYVSFGLQEGKIYPYTIRALVLASDSEGQADSSGRRWVWITKTAYLRAGERVGVTFSDNLDLERQLAQVEPANIY